MKSIYSTAYFYIYYDPIDNSPFLVGKGSDGRCDDHLNIKGKTCNKRKTQKIKQLLKNNTPPIVRVFPVETEDIAYLCEEFLIDHWGRKGIDKGGILLNLIRGGKGGVKGTKRSKSCKAKISASNKRRGARSQETKDKLSKFFEQPHHLIFPDGHDDEVIMNMDKFMEGKGLSKSQMRKVRLGKLEEHRGYRFFGITCKNPPPKRNHRWLIVPPTEPEIIVETLQKYCVERKLDPAKMCRVAAGKQLHHKGYKCKNLSKENGENVRSPHQNGISKTTKQKYVIL